MTTIVALNPNLDVFTGPHISASGFPAPQKLNMKQRLVVAIRRYRAGGIRTRDLLNPIQAHYQAVLRPEGRTIRRPVALAKFFSGATEKGET
jgi:hypothetical protein